MKRMIWMLTIAAAWQMQAQEWFGQNKPIYKDFDFKVYESPHFELYSYLKNDMVRTKFLTDAEEWFAKHSLVFRETHFTSKIPIILYNNHADFQQTTAIMGSIGVGTGGVTEALKTRVVMPLRPSYGQTRHVLGHELVHAFQYTHVKESAFLSFQHLSNVPLWMVEGMAEYMSLGRKDAHTAMWMRDAVLNGFFPARHKDMYKPKYFPYRYGQNFWAFFGATYGDDQIERMYDATLRQGPERAFDSLYGIKIDTFFRRWKTANETYYRRFLAGRDTVAKGKVLFNKKNAGAVNISPSISPDGTKMIFLSEKQVISLDLYLADLETGKTKIIASRTMATHIDAIDAYESAGTWSPDGKYFVFVIFKKGKNQLAVVDVQKRKVVKTWKVKGLDSFSNPQWSPDGKTILLLGQEDGYTDLYLYHIDTKEVTRLTNDWYAEMTPSWSPDGKKIVFSTDYYYLKHDKYPVHYHLGILDLETGRKSYPGIFPGADNLNPVYDREGRNIYFLSDREGFRDLYRYEPATGKVYQKTKFFTGISGITKFSPAITVNPRNGEIIYNHFNNHEYAIYSVHPRDLYDIPVNGQDVHKEAALLPPPVNVQKAMELLARRKLPKYGLVDALILMPLDTVQPQIVEKKYKPKFKLDYISSMGFGMTTSIYGTGLQGGVNMIFSDILGKNMISAAVSLNGEIYDFAAMAMYFNQGKKRQMGIYVSHIPYPSYMQDVVPAVVDGNYYLVYRYFLIRMFEDKIGAFRLFPFSRTLRLEAGGSFARYSFRVDSYNYFYPYDPVSGYVYPQPVYFERRKEGTFPGFNLGEANTALVGDNSIFGMTAPMKGMRYRLGYQRYFGEANFNTASADFRYYKYVKPLTFAWRVMHINRFGKHLNENNIIYPFFITYEYFIRGYSFDVLARYVQTTHTDLSLNDLMGNKVLVGNFEVRLPFTGPERLALIKSSFLFSDLNWFVDAGWVWNPGDKLSLSTDPAPGERRLWASTGFSWRINLFGQLIVQPYISRPLSLKGYDRWSFGLNFYPGF
ncbi:MAG: BamA/TamA family outer membrane protein [Chlorobi bacterium]|nr:BamA/TamA family outer membrane protein [Chlorobiota bacterium]